METLKAKATGRFFKVKQLEVVKRQCHSESDFTALLEGRNPKEDKKMLFSFESNRKTPSDSPLLTEMKRSQSAPPEEVASPIPFVITPTNA